jgi:hypothetical protein
VSYFTHGCVGPEFPRPIGFTRPRWSRQRRPSARFSRLPPIGSVLSLWVTMASSEPTKTSYAQSASGIGLRKASDTAAIRRLILAGGEVERFRDPARPYLHPQDVEIALDIDRYDFAVRVNFENGRPVARVETPPITMSKSPI